MERCATCILLQYCEKQKKGFMSCQDMVNLYNAGLLIPAEITKKSEFQEVIKNAQKGFYRGISRTHAKGT